MAQYKVLDPEQEIPCPYNRCEMIRAKRMPYHLIKCRRASTGRLIYNSEKKYGFFLKYFLNQGFVCSFSFGIHKNRWGICSKTKKLLGISGEVIKVLPSILIHIIVECYVFWNQLLVIF